MLVAYGDFVIVEPVEDDMSSTIIVPDSAKNRPVCGRVLSVGPGPRGKDGQYHPLRVAVGEVIYFAKFSVNEIEHERTKYKVVAERDILAVVHPNKKEKR